MRYNSDPLAPHSAITGIAEIYKVGGIRDHCYITAENIDFRLWHGLIIEFAVDATFTKHAPQKVYYAAEKRFFKFKGPRLFKIK
jgi:hypothetical protein